jgi:ankyrin repeat protein
LVAQIIAEREAAERTEAENRLKENPSAELLLAARNGNIVRVIASLNLEADVDTQSASNGYTPLTWASSRGHTEVVRLLLEAGADLNRTANDGQTALMRAADYGHVDVLQLLLDAGADVNVKSVNGITALRFATLKGNSRIIDMLKAAGAR